MAGGAGLTNRVAKTTIEEWSKVVSDEATKHLPHIAMLRSKGRIKQGEASGGGMRWVVRVKDHTLSSFKNMSPIEFTPLDTKKSATLRWGSYKMVEVITERERLEQGGPEAMIKIFANREEVMRRAAIRQLADKFYVDGDLAANDSNEEFHGIESMMGISAQTDTDALATTHNDTYAGLSTAVAGLDATNTRVWTPTIVSTDKVISSVNQTWANFGDEYVRKLILNTQFGAASSTDLITLTKDSYEEFLNLLDGKERFNVARGRGQALASLGFVNVEFDGIPVIWDAAVPTTDSDSATVRGYSWSFDNMELRLLNKGNLFTSRHTYNSSYAADEILLYMVGNIKFVSPRYFGKLADISAVT